MKLLISIIRPYHLEFVQKALANVDVVLTSISEVVGGGNEPGYKLIYREREVVVRSPKVRVELMVEDWQAEDIFDLILESTVAGCPGNVSDAKIMVLQLEDRHALHNRERGSVRTRSNRIGALCAT